MANRFAAGAAGLPFAVLRGYAGTDLERLTNVERIACPFTGEGLAVVAALRPDAGRRP
jgi:glutaconate CoA-transferase subunit A